jgi:hypothetical protein
MVFSDEMLLDIKEFCLLLCLPEVDRAPPRAKEERHVACAFARVAAKEAMILRKKVTSTASKGNRENKQKYSHPKLRATTYLKSLSERTPNLPATCCSPELLLRHS